jgi:hypothetical protein
MVLLIGIVINQAANANVNQDSLGNVVTNVKLDIMVKTNVIHVIVAMTVLSKMFAVKKMVHVYVNQISLEKDVMNAHQDITITRIV